MRSRKGDSGWLFLIFWTDQTTRSIDSKQELLKSEVMFRVGPRKIMIRSGPSGLALPATAWKFRTFSLLFYGDGLAFHHHFNQPIKLLGVELLMAVMQKCMVGTKAEALFSTGTMGMGWGPLSPLQFTLCTFLAVTESCFPCFSFCLVRLWFL